MVDCVAAVPLKAESCERTRLNTVAPRQLSSVRTSWASANDWIRPTNRPPNCARVWLSSADWRAMLRTTASRFFERCASSRRVSLRCSSAAFSAVTSIEVHSTPWPFAFGDIGSTQSRNHSVPPARARAMSRLSPLPLAATRCLQAVSLSLAVAGKRSPSERPAKAVSPSNRKVGLRAPTYLRSPSCDESPIPAPRSAAQKSSDDAIPRIRSPSFSAFLAIATAPDQKPAADHDCDQVKLRLFLWFLAAASEVLQRCGRSMP